MSPIKFYVDSEPSVNNLKISNDDNSIIMIEKIEVIKKENKNKTKKEIVKLEQN